MELATLSNPAPTPSPRRKKRTALPSCIVSAMDEINHAIQKVKALVPVATQVSALMADFGDLNPILYINLGNHQLNVYCYPKAMARVVDLMRALRRLGIRGTGKMQEGGCFTADMGQVYLLASFGSLAEAKCKRVQVGTREVPIFEVRCDNSADAIPEVVSGPEVVISHEITPGDEPVF